MEPKVETFYWVQSFLVSSPSHQAQRTSMQMQAVKDMRCAFKCYARCPTLLDWTAPKIEIRQSQDFSLQSFMHIIP